jgi:PAS domain S-box-containing protein
MRDIKETILAVDDTSESLALLVAALSEEGYTVLPADSGELALQAVELNRPDLILLDVRMKGISGLDVCRRLKADEKTKDVPIILISAFAEVDEWVEGLRLGASDYITKPFQNTELMTRVKTHLAVSKLQHSLQMQNSALVESRLRLESEIAKRKENENEFGMLFREMPEGFSLHDIICNDDGKPVDYRFLDVNPAFERLTGRSREEVVGKTVLSVFPRTESYWIEKFGAVALTGEPILFDGYAVEQSKYFKVAAYRSAPNRFACVFSDKSSEYTNAENIFRLNFALKAAGLGAWELNLVDHTAWRSYGHAEIFGYSTSLPEWSFELFLAHVLPEDRERVKLLMEHSRATKSELVFETRIKREDDAVRWIWVKGNPLFDSSGNPVKMFGVVQDITARKSAEEILLHERDLLQTVMDGAKNSHLVYLDREFNFVRVNATYAASCGYRPEEMIGKNHFEFYPNPKIEEVFARVRDTGEPFEIHDSPFEFPNQPDRGITYWDWTLTPAKDGDGNVSGLVFSLIETTERKRTEETQRNIQKLESLGNLAAGIAHDFNNLLAGMFGYVEIAMDEIDNNNYNDARTSLKNAFSVFERTRALTRQLLTFAEGGAPIRQRNESAPMIRNAVNNALSGCGVTALFNIDDNLWQCNCDKFQIEQAIGNIVINAAQAEPSFGQIVVSAGNEHIGPNPTASGRRIGNFIRVSIGDHGTGIAKEHLSKIFDPFFSTKEVGRGLGLTVSYSIINRHDGMIQVESDKDIGTVFHVFLPALPNLEADTKGDRVDISDHRARALIMDDEKIVRETMGAALYRMGYEVVEAADGKEALSLFSSAGDGRRPFDLVILDLVVHNGMDGKETVKAIRAQDINIPVFAVSGYADDPAMSHPDQFGFTASICKPFSRGELKEMLNVYLKRRI